jgi:hypothetical protein
MAAPIAIAPRKHSECARSDTFGNFIVWFSLRDSGEQIKAA